MTRDDQHDTLKHYLDDFRQHLTPLASHPSHQEARHALQVLTRRPYTTPSRADLLAVMEASLGVDDLHVAALVDAGEEWLALEAPHELEHHLTFRVCQRFAQGDDAARLRAMTGENGWHQLFDDDAGLAAINTDRRLVVTLTPPGEQSPVWSAATHQAYSEPGLGHVALCVLQAARGSVSLDALHDTPMSHLPLVAEHLREHASREEQLCFWQPPGMTEQPAPA